MADKPISDPLCRSIGNISSPSRFFFPTVIGCVGDKSTQLIAQLVAK